MYKMFDGDINSCTYIYRKIDYLLRVMRIIFSVNELNTSNSRLLTVEKCKK